MQFKMRENLLLLSIGKLISIESQKDITANSFRIAGLIRRHSRDYETPGSIEHVACHADSLGT